MPMRWGGWRLVSSARSGGSSVTGGAGATGPPFVNNVDFQLATPVTAGQVVGTVTATQPVSSWTLVADSSSAFPGAASPGPTGSSSPPSIQINPTNVPFFSIDNSG